MFIIKLFLNKKTIFLHIPTIINIKNVIYKGVNNPTIIQNRYTNLVRYTDINSIDLPILILVTSIFL